MGRHLHRLVIVVGLTAGPLPAAAQLFSPGELAAPHAQLEGLKNCLKCHERGERLANDLCFSCHGEIATRAKAGRGYHGQAAVRGQSCASCHHEHRGRDFDLIKWTPSRTEFDHAQTGFPLGRGHAAVKCEACHEPRFIDDPKVLALRREQKRADTYLGVSRRCATCHFDEHRGQEGDRCESCHHDTAWKPATRFSHDKESKFPLKGKHASVACGKCHGKDVDEKTPAGAFPSPKSREFMRLRGIAHAACTDCHRDVHRGVFGARCDRCHQESSWHHLDKSVGDLRFHDKTRYPLRGAHADVACKSCHETRPGKALVYRGLQFATCSACHTDAHVGQLGKIDPGGPGACERCHDVNGFVPVLFDLAAHERTRYRLTDSHAAVPCDRCHRDEPSLAARVPEPVSKRLQAQGRPVTVSLALLKLDLPLARCDSCHRDPHGGQFRERVKAHGCADCHNTQSFARVAFDHQRETRFALSGAHRDAPCEGCHRRPAPGQPVTYRPLAAACEACHRDVHVGQLSAGATPCDKCHTTDNFKPTRFDHNDSRFAAFALDGAHARKECQVCHFRVEVASKVDVARYKPLPTGCDGCHADYHRGKFRGIDLAGLFAGKSERAAASRTACEQCHTTDGWARVHVEKHDETGFPLNDAHALAPCSACHRAGYAVPIPAACHACHRDPHAGELGAECSACHDARSWETRLDAPAHRRTGFPLVGRHAIIPCRECHTAFRRGFAGAAVRCVECHRDDYEGAALFSIDHRAYGFDTTCRACHTPWRFSPAAFPAHDSCFATSRGPHARYRCRDCHDPLPQTGIGSCTSMTATCTECHEHACTRMNEEHDDVPGYECRDRKCYECHRFSR